MTSPIPFLGAFGGGQSPSFNAPLITTLVPNSSGGDSTPTYTRATTAYVTDFEGLLKQVPSGCARFSGARFVRNLVSAPENLNGVLWTKQAGSVVTQISGSEWEIDISACAVNTGVYFNSPAVFVVGNKATLQVALRVVASSGDNTVKIGEPQATQFADYSTPTLTDSWTITSKVAVTTTITTIGMWFKNTAGKATIFRIRQPQIEDVTGQSNQNPSEYVSVGVLSAPYHGAGADGVKYFDYENPNTVTDNVVTEATGAAIPDATLKGYFAEGQRQNRCLYSQDFSNAAWVSGGGGIAVTPNTAVAPDGTTTADTLTASGANGTLIQDLGVVASAAKAGGLYLKRKTGTGNIDLTLDGGATWTTVAVTSDWLLLEKTQTLADEDFGIRIVTSGDAVYAWQAQVETAAFISSPIPTTTAAVTRNADVLTYQISGNANNVIGTAYIEVHANRLLDPTTSICLSLSTASGQLIAFVSATNAVAWDGVNFLAKTGLTSYLTGIRKRASSWGSSGISITGDGENPATSLFDGTMGDGTGNIKIAAGNEYINCKNARIWTKQLSDAQLMSMTTP